MTDFNPRTVTDTADNSEATGRGSAERSEVEHLSGSGKSTEVLPKRTNRRWSAKEKLRVLAAAEACVKHGELGALLRREGIYSSHLAKWRALREQGELGALGEKKRGRKPADAHPLVAKLAESEKKNRTLTKKLERAEEIISFQKKFAEMFGKIITLPDDIEKM